MYGMTVVHIDRMVFFIQNHHNFQVDSQKYRGFGTSKQLAKQAAAEAALISFVKPPVINATTKEAKEEDKTPWATLASFAIYKLFNDWRDGRVGMCPPPGNQPYAASVPAGKYAHCPPFCKF